MFRSKVPIGFPFASNGLGTGAVGTGWDAGTEPWGSEPLGTVSTLAGKVVAFLWGDLLLLGVDSHLLVDLHP